MRVPFSARAGNLPNQNESPKKSPRGICMDNCMVSIIIPFYNSDSTIRQALQSVLCQRLKGNLNGTGCENDCTAEVIIVDASDSFSEKMISGIYNPYGYSVRCIGGGVNMDAGEARKEGIKCTLERKNVVEDADEEKKNIAVRFLKKFSGMV